MTTNELYWQAAQEANELHKVVTHVMVNGTRKELRKAQDARRKAELKRDELYAQIAQGK